LLALSLSLVAAAACSGGKSSSSSTTTTTTATSPGASPASSSNTTAMAPKNPKLGKPAATVAMNGAAAAGAKVFSANCASCHQPNGKGLPGTFPPLAGNSVVTGPATTVIHIVKNGLNGKISVNGKTYNGQMPAWKGTLSNSDIAAVITYVRSAWGNHASAVTAAQVSAAK
jgi:mono/diheme cytochrome c family protein